MTWQFFLTVAIFTAVTERLLHRFFLRRFEDSLIYTLFYQAAAATLLLPFCILELTQNGLRAPLSLSTGLLMIAQAIFWALFGYFSFSADRLLESSQSAIVSRLRMIWALVIGILIFKEDISFRQSLGVALIFSSVLMIGFPISSKKINPKGLLLSILSTLSISISLAIDKTLTQTFNSIVVAFFAFSFSAIVMFFVTKEKSKRISELYRFAGNRIFIPPVLGAVSHGALVFTLSIGKLALVVPIYQSGTVLTVLFGIVLLHERSHFWTKLLAACLTTLGIWAIVL